MFSEPLLNGVNDLFTAPGLSLELVGAGLSALGVFCYCARIAWISVTHARRIERTQVRQASQRTAEHSSTKPYCAG